jgi:hypothetical protein
MQANEQRVSAPVTLRELYGGARCLSCRQQDRRCHVEYNVDQCLQCGREDVCVFERTVKRTGPSRDFSWHELIGDTEVDATLDAGRVGRVARLGPPTPWRPPQDSVNDSSAAHRPGVETVEQIGSTGLHHDRQSDRASVTGGSPSVRRAGQDIIDGADLNATIYALPPEPHSLGTRSRLSLTYPHHLLCGPTPENHNHKAYERGQASFNNLSGFGSDEGRTSSGLISTSLHSRTDDKTHKSYACRIPLCPRQFKGFSNVNDLERHQKSVHGIQPNRPSTTRLYKCFGTKCSRPDRMWPRLDNFKHHLKKMHCDEDTDELIAK